MGWLLLTVLAAGLVGPLHVEAEDRWPRAVNRFDWAVASVVFGMGLCLSLAVITLLAWSLAT